MSRESAGLRETRLAGAGRSAIVILIFFMEMRPLRRLHFDYNLEHR